MRQPSRREGSPKQVIETETAPAPTVRSPIRLSYTTVIFVQRAWVSPMANYRVGGSVSVSPFEVKLVDFVGFLVVFLIPLTPMFLPPPCHRIPLVLPNICLWVSASVSISC